MPMSPPQHLGQWAVEGWVLDLEGHGGVTLASWGALGTMYQLEYSYKEKSQEILMCF